MLPHSCGTPAPALPPPTAGACHIVTHFLCSRKHHKSAAGALDTGLLFSPAESSPVNDQAAGQTRQLCNFTTARQSGKQRTCEGVSVEVEHLCAALCGRGLTHTTPLQLTKRPPGCRVTTRVCISPAGGVCSSSACCELSVRRRARYERARPGRWVEQVTTPLSGCRARAGDGVGCR